ncbi:MAG TPA: isoprenylcysteine carboxylmethyltransferase family protein [Acidimicrobiales bacterium]|nr:isoprenylcysteine carboxylmethyltransferase family protein [Acidimicrobiales bacterium]
MRVLDAAPAPRAGSAALRRPGGSISDLRYLLTGRVIPAVLYALLGYGVAVHAVWLAGHLTQVTWLTVIGGPIREALFGAFCLIPVVLFVVRPKPKAADGRVLPRVVAFVGTAILLVLGTGIPEGVRLVSIPGWVGSAASLVLAAVTAGAVWGLLTLRLSFGIFPAARRLVTGGPYRLVRHPLYFCEIAAALAMLASDGHLVPLVVVTVFVVLQVTRIRYEESLLRDTFPAWRDWAAGRARLIPGIW